MTDHPDIVERLEEPWTEPARSADDEVQKLYTLCRKAAAEITRLRAEAEALRKDAERYRFIRNECSGEPRRGTIAPAILLFGLQGKAEDAWCEAATATNHLTETLDAAISATKEQQA